MGDLLRFIKQLSKESDDFRKDLNFDNIFSTGKKNQKLFKEDDFTLIGHVIKSMWLVPDVTFREFVAFMLSNYPIKEVDSIIDSKRDEFDFMVSQNQKDIQTNRKRAIEKGPGDSL